MKTHSLKPFDDGKYLSEEDALKLLETIPIPKDDPGSVNPPPNKNSDLGDMVIDLNPAAQGNLKSQDEWITYWNNINNGRIFASMADYYHAFKQLKEKFEQGSIKEKQITQLIINSLGEDFDWPNQNSWLVSSTRIKYRPDREDAQIIHYYNCHNKSVIQKHNLIIPEYLGVLVSEVLNDPKGLTYLQTLFGTQDDKEAMMQNLEFISYSPRTVIKILTPPIKEDLNYANRQGLSERASGIFKGNSGILVCDDYIVTRGRSRGVRLNVTPKNGGAP